MRNILRKELTLSASKLTYFFLLFALITLLPGYPILLGSFFVSFGVFQSFQSAREANDIVYSVLLPVSKADIVRGKYAFSVFIELCGFAGMFILTLLRMTVLRNLAPYTANALMTANPFFLGFALVLFGVFNAVFLGGFFKTAYYYGKPFIAFIVLSMLLIGMAETLHHIPGLEALNAFGFDHALLQWRLLVIGAVIFVVLTLLSLRKSISRFERIDL